MSCLLMIINGSIEKRKNFVVSSSDKSSARWIFPLVLLIVENMFIVFLLIYKHGM